MFVAQILIFLLFHSGNLNKVSQILVVGGSKQGQVL